MKLIWPSRKPCGERVDSFVRMQLLDLARTLTRDSGLVLFRIFAQGK
ncbi:hypothetical protein ABNC51_14440 [Paenibacillus larvae]